MTLQSRNRWFVVGIIFSALIVFFVGALALKILPAYPGAAEESLRRSPGLIQKFVGGKLENSPYVPFVTAVGGAVYALISISLIYYFFEKTQAPEILYISIFAVSLAFECGRIMIPLVKALNFPTAYMVLGSRFLIFGRSLGLFSLFAASVCAAGLDVQRQRNIVLSIFAAALVLALGVPIDGLSWDSSLEMISGYSSMFKIVEEGILILTVVSFFVSAYTRGHKQYLFIGIGILLVYAGRNILFSSDTWITLGPGIIVLSIGTWGICTQLHRVYLWL
jgi:hypothetical protein